MKILDLDPDLADKEISGTRFATSKYNRTQVSFSLELLKRKAARLVGRA